MSLQKNHLGGNFFHQFLLQSAVISLALNNGWVRLSISGMNRLHTSCFVLLRIYWRGGNQRLQRLRVLACLYINAQVENRCDVGKTIGRTTTSRHEFRRLERKVHSDKFLNSMHFLLKFESPSFLYCYTKFNTLLSFPNSLWFQINLCNFEKYFSRHQRQSDF